MKKCLGLFALFPLVAPHAAELGLPKKTIVVSDFARKRQDLLDTLRVNLPGAKVGIRRFRGAEVVLRVDYPLDRPPAQPKEARGELRAHADRLIREAYPGFELAPDSVFRFVPKGPTKGSPLRPQGPIRTGAPVRTAALEAAEPSPKASSEPGGLDPESSARLGRLLESWRQRKEGKKPGLNPKLFGKKTAPRPGPENLDSIQDELALLAGSEARLGLSKAPVPATAAKPKTGLSPKARLPRVAQAAPSPRAPRVKPGISSATLAQIREFQESEAKKGSSTSMVQDIYSQIFQGLEADRALAKAKAAELDLEDTPPALAAEGQELEPAPEDDPLFHSQPADQSLSQALEEGLAPAPGL